MSVAIHKPGFQTTVQDLGRFGYQQLGITVSGPMDAFALQAANLVLGNEASTPALEFALHGAELTIMRDTWICLSGADLHAEVSGMRIPLWRPVAVRAGSKIRCLRVERGMRAYLAVSGGFQVEQVMNSSSTHLMGGFGGFAGRALQPGDRLQIAALTPRAQRLWEEAFRELPESESLAVTKWGVSLYQLPNYREEPIVRVIRGAEADWFTSESRTAFLQSLYRISAQSDRMGYRLEGTPLSLKHEQQMLSEAVTAGTMQVPPDGEPIVLMADRQTTGGYPRIAQVIQVDLPVLAQTQPGKRVGFVEIPFEEAERLWLEEENALRQLRWAAARFWGGEH